MEKLHGKLSHIQTLRGTLSCAPTLNGTLATLNPFDVYSGETEIIPSQQIQVLQTAGKVLKEDIVVAGLPENYGLIAWNGSVLTVS